MAGALARVVLIGALSQPVWAAAGDGAAHGSEMPATPGSATPPSAQPAPAAPGDAAAPGPGSDPRSPPAAETQAAPESPPPTGAPPPSSAEPPAATTAPPPVVIPRAEPPAPGGRDRHRASVPPVRPTLALDLGFTTTSSTGQKALLVSPALSYTHPVFGGGTALELHLGVAGLHLSARGGASEGRVAMGNPGVGISHPWRVGDFTLRAGVDAAVGLFSMPQDINDARLARNALAYASDARGLWSAWEWLPVQFAIAFPVELAPIPLGPVRVGAEAAAAYVLRARSIIPTGQTTYGDVYVQAAATATLPLEPARVGLRAQAVGFWTGSPEHAQTAVAPFAGLRAGATDLELRFLVPLDAPLSRVAPWALELGAAAEF